MQGLSLLISFAQVEQMKLAGLNPALAYGMGGGGVTANVATGKTSGGQAPSGGGEIVAAQAMGLQLRMKKHKSRI